MTSSHRPPTLRRRVRALLALTYVLPVLAGPSVSSACERCRPATAATRDGAVRLDMVELLRGLDQGAAAAASAQSRLTWPARIGIARLEHGTATPIPPAEWTHWRTLRDQAPPTVADISPVTTLLAQSITSGPVSPTPHDAIANLRFAAAREHLDLIILYDVSIEHTMQRTEATLLDATIVGAWIFPTHRSHATAHASAVLIDVRSGLSYGSVISGAPDTCSATLLGSEEKLHRQRALVARRAVTGLATEVQGLLSRIAAYPMRPDIRADDRGPIRPAGRASQTHAGAPETIEADTAVPPQRDSGASFWERR